MCLCFMLLYFNLLYLVLFFALLHSTLLCIISLRFTLLYALLSSTPLFFKSSVYFAHALLFALYTLYFTLLCSIFAPLYSRLLCIASFLYITSFTSFRIIARFAFLIFFSSVFAPILTSPLLGTSHVLLYYLNNGIKQISKICGL